VSKQGELSDSDRKRLDKLARGIFAAAAAYRKGTTIGHEFRAVSDLKFGDIWYELAELVERASNPLGA
jgi:hypothetical protein